MRANCFIFCLTIIIIVAAACLTHAENIPFEDARMIIEFNSTDEDIGIQIFLDAEGWRKVSVIAPNGVTIFESRGFSTLKKQGLTELFFESEEPTLDEVPLTEFLARFPEGEYQFVGTTIEGDTLVGKATFTHNIPDGPFILSPQKTDVLDPDKVVVDWDPVTTPAGIVIAEYQVIIETGHPGKVRTFEVDVPADVTRVKVPKGFLLSGKKYKVEVLAKEKGGNQTITERTFHTTE